MKCCEWHERLEFSLEPNKEALNTHHSLIKRRKKSEAANIYLQFHYCLFTMKFNEKTEFSNGT